jgi:hypothetical protein
VGELLLISVVKRRKVRAIAVSGDLSDLAEGRNGTANDGAGFRVSNDTLDLDQAGEKLGNERSDNDMGVDELGHVVDDAKNRK